MLEQVRFEWDVKKEATNIAKHGVDFAEARSVFYDPHFVMAADQGHSISEPRLFCIGRSENGNVVTVRFTYRGDRVSNYWRRILAERQKNL